MNRINARREQLTLLALITNDWPNNFKKYIHKIGVTQRYFSRIHLPNEIVQYINQLPAGHCQKTRTNNKHIFASIKKYRAKNPDKYRKLRAEIIWQKIGENNE